MIRLLSLLTLCLFVSLPALAAPPKPANLSEQDKADIARVEKYLNGVTTMKARFLQVASTGAVAEGTLTLARPGRMRFEYDPPTPTMVIADGTYLIFIDKQLDTTTHVFLRNTPVGVLVDENIKLSGAVTVTRMSRAAGVVRITLVRTESPEDGTLTLVFSDQPMQLRQWIVVDSQGVETKVTLGEPEFGVPVTRAMFQYDKAPQRND
jgi:outer membrane lipoprotein-sorting protein